MIINSNMGSFRKSWLLQLSVTFICVCVLRYRLMDNPGFLASCATAKRGFLFLFDKVQIKISCYLASHVNQSPSRVLMRASPDVNQRIRLQVHRIFCLRLIK